MRGRLVLVVAMASTAAPAWAATVRVPGTAAPGFAGQSAAISSSLRRSGRADFYGDGAANIPPYLDITKWTGEALNISATGAWGFGAPYRQGPAGGSFAEFGTNGSGVSYSEYDLFGVTTMVGPFGGLTGVFLGPEAPTGPGPAPLTMTTLTPALRQEFYIGSSLDGLAIPTGATRLYFGLHDGFEWNNNVGWVDVTVTSTSVPEPSVAALMVVGLAVLCRRMRRRPSRARSPGT